MGSREQGTLARTVRGARVLRLQTTRLRVRERGQLTRTVAWPRVRTRTDRRQEERERRDRRTCALRQRSEVAAVRADADALLAS